MDNSIEQTVLREVCADTRQIIWVKKKKPEPEYIFVVDGNELRFKSKTISKKVELHLSDSEASNSTTSTTTAASKTTASTTAASTTAASTTTKASVMSYPVQQSGQFSHSNVFNQYDYSYQPNFAQNQFSNSYANNCFANNYASNYFYPNRLND